MELNRFVRFALPGVVLLSALAPPAFAGNGRARSDIALYVRQCGAALACNGAYLVAQHGEIIYQGATGRMSTTRRTPVSNDTAFDIGSISKQFTAAAIVRLAEQHKLGLDDRAADHLAGFPYPTITIRQLLTQTSGVPDVMPHYTRVVLGGAAQEPIDLADIVDVLRTENLPLASPPGSTFAYSNTGYTLLGRIIESASGKTFATFLAEEFFQPLGMEHTWVRTPASESGATPARAQGMRRTRNGSLKPNDQIANLFLYGAGGVYSTTRDLLVWANALGSGKVMSPAHWAEATTPTDLADGSRSRYGFGLDLKPSVLGNRSIAHGGHWRGFKSDLTMLPDDEVTIVILTNNSEDDEVEDARNAFIGILHKDADLTRVSD